MTIFNLLPSLRNRKALIAVSTCAALTLVLTGCGLGTAAPALPDNSSTHGVALHGIAHGGQQGIVGGTVQLWEAGGTSSSSTSGAGYGAGAIALISNPVTTGGNVASLAPSFAVTAYSVTSNVATFTTAAQTFSVGQAVTLSGFANGTFFNGQTVTVLAAGLTSTSFEANFVNANTSGAETTASVTLATPGSFNITGDYTCHTGALVYLTVTGGTAGTGVNSAINLVAPLGLCSSLSASTFININEVTTAAAAYALGNFYTTAGGIGAPATTQAQVGLTNAFNTVNNLVSIATGAAQTSLTLTANSITVTGTPEASKLYLLADILAACVNSSGPSSSGCSTLFSNVVTPPTGGVTPPTPVDVMQAAVDMSLNPSAGSTAALSNLAALQTAQSPYIGSAQSSTPTPIDLTVGILYTDTTTSLLLPQNLAIDAGGNIWILNHNGTTSASLAEFSPTMTPIVNNTSIASNALAAAQPRNEAIDTNGNVWLETTSTGGVYEYNTATPASSIKITTSGSQYSVAIDGNNDVYFSKETATCSGFMFDEFTSGTLNASNQIQFPCPSAPTPQGEYAAIDTNGNMWATNGNSAATPETFIEEISPVTQPPCTAPCTATVTTQFTYTQMTSGGNSGAIPTLNTPWGVAAAPGGVMWVANNGTGDVVEMTSNAAGTPFGSASSFPRPEWLAVDGAGNVWVSNFTTPAPSTVGELSSTGAILSPGTGFSHSGLIDNSSLGIDPSGNIWVANNSAASAGVFELVGAGVPTVTPISLALKNTKVGAKP